MGFVNDFIQGLKKAIPALVKKLVAFLFFIFILGMLFGYWVIATGKPSYYLLIPVISMLVIYYKLDEGFLLFIILMLAAFML
jgi:hypothetical protein